MAQKREKNKLGQYFTPRHVAGLMLSLSDCDFDARILEPSSGQGVFLDILSEAGFTNAVGVEIDPDLAKHPVFEVKNESFLSHDSSVKYDMVIGNPPYIRWKDLDESAKEEFKSLPDWNVLFNSLSDYLIPFISKSISHLNKGGELIFVTPSFWMHTQHSESLREWMLTQGNVKQILAFDEASVFPGVASSIIIFRFVKGTPSNDPVDLYTWLGLRKLPTENLTIDNEELFQHTQIPAFKSKHHWTLAPQETQVRLDNLEVSCSSTNNDSLFGDASKNTLGDVVDIANGMVSGLDAAFKVDEDLLGRLTETERSALMTVTKAFQLEPIFTDRTVPYINIPNGLSEEEVRRDYPNLIAHLEPMKDDLLKRYSYARDLPFWEWAFRRSETFFFNGKSKAFVPCKERLTSKPHVRFALVPDGVIATQDVTAFAPKDGVRESLEFIVAFLTIPEITDWVRHRGLMKGGVAEFSERPLAGIPFRRINWDNKVEVEIHDQIREKFLALKSDSIGDRTQAQKAMHLLVYKLLGLPVSVKG
jgi:adenine-specific DNA-methyltransferase